MEEGRQSLLCLTIVCPNSPPAPKRNGEQLLTEDILQFSPKKPMIMPCCMSSAMLPIEMCWGLRCKRCNGRRGQLGGVQVFKFPEPLKLLWEEGGKDKEWRGKHRMWWRMEVWHFHVLVTSGHGSCNRNLKTWSLIFLQLIKQNLREKHIAQRR